MTEREQGTGVPPRVSIIIPIYKMMRSADLLNTWASLVIAYVSVTLPVAIWMLRGFLLKLPVELEEAATIDGAGPFRVFRDVVVPLARPGVIATAVYVLIVTWQEFLFALSFTSTLRLLATIDGAQRIGSQVICATHSPVLASLPGAEILELGEHGIRPSPGTSSSSWTIGGSS